MDFEQGRITRIHDLSMNFGNLKSRLKDLNQKYPSGVIIPLHRNDLGNPGLKRIRRSRPFNTRSRTGSPTHSRAGRRFRRVPSAPATVFQALVAVVWASPPSPAAALRSITESNRQRCNVTGKSTTPRLSTEVFDIGIEDNRFILYAPLRRAAFVGNAEMLAAEFREIFPGRLLESSIQSCSGVYFLLIRVVRATISGT